MRQVNVQIADMHICDLDPLLDRSSRRYKGALSRSPTERSSMNFLSQRPIGMNQHLGVSLNSLVELVVRHLRVFDANLMAYNK